jgi:hypothetical protein
MSTTRLSMTTPAASPKPPTQKIELNTPEGDDVTEA